MKHYLSLLGAAAAALALSGCLTTPAPRATPEKAPAASGTPLAVALAPAPDVKSPVMTTVVPVALPEVTVVTMKLTEKLMKEGAQYVLYSTDPPVTFELPSGPIQLEGPSSKLVMRYVVQHNCIPLSNTTSMGNPLLALCLESDKKVLRTFESMSYVALRAVSVDPLAVPLPPEDLMELPSEAPGESDEGEGDDAPDLKTIIALPQGGDGVTGYEVAEYEVVPNPLDWASGTTLGKFTESAGCKLLQSLTTPTEQFALCYIEDELSILPLTDLNALAPKPALKVAKTLARR